MSIKTILSASQQIQANRNVCSIMNKVVEEVGELAQEVNISTGMSYKEAGPDGITGEAVDAIIALVDLIRVANPDITVDDINAVIHQKVSKWAAKTNSVVL